MDLEERLLSIAAELDAEEPSSVTDADTFAIDADTFVQGDGTRIRIAGVDAPETGKMNPADREYQPQEAGADIATEMLREMLANEDIEVTPTGQQSYDRQVAEVTASGRDVGERLIERGVARPTMFSGQGQRTAEVTANLRNSGLFDDALTSEDLILNRQLAYEKEINGFDPDYSRVDSGPSTARGTLSRAVSRGTDNTQALLYAATNAFGEITGLEGIEDWGDEGVRRNMTEAALAPAEIGEFDNVDSLGKFWTYSVEAVGEQIPNIALTAVGAGGATMVARAAMGKALMQRATAQAGARFAGLQPVGGAADAMKGIIAKDAAKIAAKTPINVGKAPLLGAAATTYPLGVGEVQQELKGAGISAPGTAFVAGLPIAASEALSFDVIFGKLFKGVKREMAEELVSGTASALGFVAAKGAKGGLVGGLTEMPTETMQELIAITAHAYHDPTYEIFSDENLHRLRETAIKAGIVGAAGGGFASSVQGVRELPPIAPPPTDETIVEPELSPEGEAEFAGVGDEVKAKDPIESIPPEHMTEVEGAAEPVNTRTLVKTLYDDQMDKLDQLAKCIGG